MALPTYVGTGTMLASGTGGTVNPPADHSTDDIDILQVETANEAQTLTTANGFVELTAVSPQGSATVPATRLTVFWRRWNGSDGSPVLADPGNHAIAVIHTFRGCITTGDPWNAAAGGVDGTADTSGSVPGATTTVPDCLVCLLVCDGQDDTSAARYTAWTNGDLANITERFDDGDIIGNGGGIGMTTGEKASAGAYANTTYTAFANVSKGMASVALQPPSAPGPSPRRNRMRQHAASGLWIPA